ncbi:hypothetical protein PYW08_005037 [Mythimna loreyi]|uniref:Uncharacterized protein n=1 Tax=Mythimna loreyi TaxID=667449 RepID=A0ACC2QFV9_9NEOP|nr:hypothetical protein PYW08_005037 [Mythimna loreyi]
MELISTNNIAKICRCGNTGFTQKDLAALFMANTRNEIDQVRRYMEYGLQKSKASPIILLAKWYRKNNVMTGSVRNLMSKQLVYSEFGDPIQVLKVREIEVPKLGTQDVLVRMLAAPINPADINTIQGKNIKPPRLPAIPGDEGVGEITEMGKHVSCVALGDRVVLASRQLGSWRYYGVFNQRDVHVIAKNLAIPEASMLTVAPCSAYRLLNDFKKVKPGETVLQNGANSPVGQSVIQLCKAKGINTFNIVASHCGYETVKAHLLKLGATTVYTLEEAEALTSFDTSLARPTLGLNCLGGRFEDVMLKLLARSGVIVYYGFAYFLPMSKQFTRCDVDFYKFNMQNWEACATSVEKDIMYKQIIQHMIIGDFIAPTHVPIELNDYILALRNTVHSEAFSTFNYVFDFTLPCS